MITYFKKNHVAKPCLGNKTLGKWSAESKLRVHTLFSRYFNYRRSFGIKNHRINPLTKFTIRMVIYNVLPLRYKLFGIRSCKRF